MASEVLFTGEHLEFRRRRGWEYVEHRTAKEAVMVVALTEDRRIVLVEEVYAARNVRFAGGAGEREREEIQVHVVSLSDLIAWSRERERAGVLIDPKVWAGLTLAAGALR